MSKNAVLIYNPAAGRFPAGPMLERTETALSHAGWTTKTLVVDPENDLASLTHQAVDEDPSAIFVVGGDGTIGQVAAGLVGNDAALGVLPAGTGNVWAQELGIPRMNWVYRAALEEAAEMLADAEERWVDVGECNGIGFLMWSGFGLDADVVHVMEPRPRWKKAFASIHYGSTALLRAMGWKGIDISAEAEGISVRGRFVFALACNIPRYAGGYMDIAPGAKVDDGLLDFWLFGGQSLGDVLLRTAQILQGKHINASGVIHFRADSAVFKVSHELPVEMDGEPIEMIPPLEYSVRKKSLKVLIPRSKSQRLFTE